jgi:hypothetical protein
MLLDQKLIENIMLRRNDIIDLLKNTSYLYDYCMIDIMKSIINHHRKIECKEEKIDYYVTSYLDEMISMIYFLSNRFDYELNDNEIIYFLFDDLIDMINKYSEMRNIGIDKRNYEILNDRISDLELEKKINKNVKVIDDSEDIYLDKLTNEFMNEPYYIKMKNEDIIVDRKTFYRILNSGVNPYTREKIDIDELITYNKSEDIINKRKKYYESIN